MNLVGMGGKRIVVAGFHALMANQDKKESIMAKTIVDLGIDDFERYARDSSLKEQSLLSLKDATISKEAIVDVTQPYFVEEWTQLFALKEPVPWAGFAPPAGYFEQRQRVFTSQLVPSLGSPGKQEMQIKRIQSVKSSSKPAEVQSGAEGPEIEVRVKDDELQQAEKKILLNFFSLMDSLNQIKLEIKLYRDQYHKA